MNQTCMIKLCSMHFIHFFRIGGSSCRTQCLTHIFKDCYSTTGTHLVMCMHTVRTVHNIFKKEFLLQYLFSLCNKLLSKGRGVGKSMKPLIWFNHIKFPASSKQWQFPSEKNCHIHCTCKHKNCCKHFLCK